MKTYLTYGFAMAFVGALLNFALYFAGYHSDPAKLTAAQVIGTVVGLGSAITFIILGIRARRAETPLTEEFGYGSALVSGIMVVLFASLIGTVLNYLYFHVINPGFADVVIQAQAQKMEAKGMSATSIEQMEAGVRRMMNPALQAAIGFVVSMFFGTLVSLIAAIFLKRSADEQPPLVA